MTEKELKAYYKETQKLLICDRKRKRAVMTELKTGIGEYISQNENATKDDIISVFGMPEEIARSVIQTADTKEIKHGFSIKKAVIAALVAAVIIYAIFVLISLIDVHTEAHGYIKEGFLYISNIIREAHFV
ncbi:MAG: hypothetical protein NC122_03130 [Faecalibacterium sp.]|nr:hypothetical protein [Ruminococcus sp.]MCM1392488.1 hypothetical protein [Ruminococcus sp.]MCM1485179.1 hypothetical protein [Faecalibacterium sp.]